MLSLNQMINAMPTLFACTVASCGNLLSKKKFPKENTPISPVIPWFDGRIKGKGTLGKMVKSIYVVPQELKATTCLRAMGVITP